MGTYKGSMAVDVEYPVAFMESMGRVLETKPSRPPFRYVQLSGKFVRQNQERKLWLMETPRKIKVGLNPIHGAGVYKSNDTYC